MIKPTDPFPEQAQDFDRDLIQAFYDVVHLVLDGDADAVNPFEQWEEPTQGRSWSRLVNLVRYGLVLLRSLLAHPTLRHRINQQRQGHHHQQPLKPTGFFHK